MAIGNYHLSTWDMIIYSMMMFIYFIGVMYCISPVIRVNRALKKAGRRLKDRTEQGAYIYNDPLFLRCKLVDDWWRRYIVNLTQLKNSNNECHVVDFINNNTMIMLTSHSSFADTLPGIMTSLGILGTFGGLVAGISSLDINTTEAMKTSISALIGGMSSAFYTSIVGVVCAVSFQMIRRLAMSRAGTTVSKFVNDCEMNVSQPLTQETNLIQTIYALLKEVKKLNETMNSFMNSFINQKIDR